jgi:oligopeptide transport system substrate-binding protein
MVDRPWGFAPPTPPPPPRRRQRNELIAGILVLALIVGTTGAILWSSGNDGRPDHAEPTRGPLRTPSGGTVSEPAPTLSGQSSGSAVIAGSAPVSWDPATIGDAGSAGLLAQVYESLTALDAQNRVEPALARSWTIADGGTSITFELRPDITFSDGSPITADDVRRSWLHVLDPSRPSPLSDLLSDVVGASDYSAGRGSADAVGINANGESLTVRFRRPAAYFASTVSSPTLAVVPPLPDAAEGPLLPQGLVASGAYVPESESGSTIALTANPHYWAGPPPIQTITVATSLDGNSPVDAFQAKSVDYTPISRDDATWIRYDASLGPQLRQADDLAVLYYGFTTSTPPFDDPDVRRAFAEAVDWDRIVTLDDPTATPATSLIPVGIEGRGTTDYSPPYDVTAAKAALSKAGFPNGSGFPTVTLVSQGGGFEEAVADELQQNLGVNVSVEVMPFDDYAARLSSGNPTFWTIDWVADYPHPEDFLGLLLGSGSRNNVGGWSDPQFEAALDRAASTADPTAQQRAYGDAQQIVADQVPVVPVAYGEDWALSRDGLLGAQENGEGFVRFAGLAWENQ